MFEFRISARNMTWMNAVDSSAAMVGMDDSERSALRSSGRVRQWLIARDSNARH